jgi:hypothetical protein
LYYAWKLHSIPPSVFSNCGIGEKIILKNFIEKEIEEINKSNAGGVE